jgi:hypothetical protein
MHGAKIKIKNSWYQFISFTAVYAAGGKGGNQFHENIYLHVSSNTRPFNYKRGHLNKTIRHLHFLEVTLVCQVLYRMTSSVMED